MTEKLFYKDAYIREFSAEVISCEEKDGKFDVVLDKTAFFPEEGGQYSDTGTLDSAEVSHVYEKNGVVHHICESALMTGRTVKGILNFEERFEKMQCHTAEHILSGLFYKYHGLSNVGFHLGAVDVTMDISSPLTRDELDKIEKMANEIIFENVEIVTRVLGNDEISSVFYRAKLDLKENVRVVFIGDYDSCACCAPHVSRTGEVGLVKILDAEKLRGGMRLHISAGRRAMCVFDSLYKTALRTSELISTPKDELYSGVEKLLNNFNNTRNEYERFRIESFTEKASKIERTDKNAVMYFEGASSAELREVANSVMERVSGFLVLLGGYDGALSYVLTNTSLDVKDVIRDINTALNGRGGGRGTMATGTFSAAREDVFRYFDVKKAP